MSYDGCRSYLEISGCAAQGLFPQSTHHQRCQPTSPQRLFPQSARLDRRKTLATPRAHPNRRTGGFRARHLLVSPFINSFLLIKEFRNILHCFAYDSFPAGCLVSARERPVCTSFRPGPLRVLLLGEHFRAFDFGPERAHMGWKLRTGFLTCIWFHERMSSDDLMRSSFIPRLQQRPFVRGVNILEELCFADEHVDRGAGRSDCMNF